VYDFIARKWGAPVAFDSSAYNDTFCAVGLFNHAVYLIGWFSSSLVARPLWLRVPLNGEPPTAKTDLPFAQFVYARALSQTCCCLLLAGGIVNESGPAPWDTSDLWMVNVQTGQSRKVGNAPWPGIPDNSDHTSFLAALPDKTYLFSSTMTVGNPNTYGQCTVSVIR
jgi:hypothetical protein